MDGKPTISIRFFFKNDSSYLNHNLIFKIESFPTQHQPEAKNSKFSIKLRVKLKKTALGTDAHLVFRPTILLNQ